MISHEEHRCWRLLKQVASEDGKELYRWRMSVGLEHGESHTDGSHAIEDALLAIQAVEAPALFVLYDLHAHINEPLVLRRLVISQKACQQTTVHRDPWFTASSAR